MPLPADLHATLSTIAKTLRNVPREAIHDPPELFVWLNRQAKALERARDMLMAVPQALARSSPPAPRVLSVRDRAEAMFSSAPVPALETTSPSLRAAAAPPRPRMVIDRKGRGVRVEVRRAREAGQMEMLL